MALVELPALDGTRQDVGDGGEKRHVVVIELAPLHSVRAEHAVGAPVTPGDRCGEAAHDAMLLQEHWA